MGKLTMEDFVNRIKAHESDTFSAVESKITKQEAHDVAAILLSSWAEGLLDGVFISTCLEEVRNDQFKST